MYEWNVKGAERRRQGFGIKRDSRPDIKQKQMSAGVFLKTGQPNMFQTAQRREEPGMPNRTGLPDSLKAGIENLSGISMDYVRAKHLPHEAWHVVQQKQGRVMPTMKFGGNFINDNPVLEREADYMGAKAVQGKFKDGALSVKNAISTCVQRQMPDAADFADYNVAIGVQQIVNNSTLVMQKPLQAQNKAEALQKISTEAARIGNKANGCLNNNESFYAEIRAEYQTKRYMERIRSNLSRIDGYKEQIEELDDNIYAEDYAKEGYREGWETDIKNLEDEIAGMTPVLLW